jgi:hypothetical protein
LLIGSVALAAVAGCGKITLEAVGPDLATGDDLGVPDLGVEMGGSDAGSPVTPVIVAKPDIVGYPTLLDGSGSTDALGRTLSFTWHITKVPAGSVVADTCGALPNGFQPCLTSTNTAKPSFEPDLGGDYAVQLTVTATGAMTDSATATTTVTVPTLPVLFYDGETFPTASQSGAAVVRSDGTGRHDVSCRAYADAGIAQGVFSGGGNAAVPMFNWLYGSFFSLRAHYPNGPAMGPARASWMEIGGLNASGQPTGVYLFAAEGTSDCQTKPPVRVDDPGFNPGTVVYGHFKPRFSPDGTRIAYFDSTVDQTTPAAQRIVTVGIDGKNVHIIRVDQAAAGGSAIYIPANIIWLDNTTVAWVENTMNVAGVPTLRVFKHADVDCGDPINGCSVNATADFWIDCGNKFTVMQQLELASLTPLTLVVSASKDPPPTNVTDIGSKGVTSQTMDLYKITDVTCTNPTNLTNGPGSSWQRDFTLTPDGRLAYVSNQAVSIPDGDSSFSYTDIWLLSLDGTIAPHKFLGDTNERTNFGPRWMAGGRQIVWTQSTMNQLFRGSHDFGLGGKGIVIANSDGTHVHALYGETGNLDAGVAPVGGNNLGFAKCSVASSDFVGATEAVVAGLVIALLLFALAVQRRRNA